MDINGRRNRWTEKLATDEIFRQMFIELCEAPKLDAPRVCRHCGRNKTGPYVCMLCSRVTTSPAAHHCNRD